MREGYFSVRGRPTELKPPVDWRMDPIENRSWRAWLHTMRFLAVPLLAYEQEGDGDALAIARDLILDWIRGNPLGSELAGDFAWTDCAGHRALFFGYARRECRRLGLLASAQDAVLTKSIRQHARWLSDEANYSGASNHGLYQDGGLFLCGIYASDLPESGEWRSLGEERLLATLREHVEWKEGLHKEHSPSYHMYVRVLIDNLQKGTGIGGGDLADLLERMDLAAGWLVMPNRGLAPFGDTDIAQRAPDFAWERTGAAEGLGWFPRTGYAFVRQGSSYLALACGYHTHAHKHADELSWCLHEGGRLLVGDAGRYGYHDERDPARLYARSSRAHNTLIVDDQSRQRWQGVEPYGSGLTAAAHERGWYAILGHNPLLDAASHRRLVLYRPGELVLIVDRIESQEEHSLHRRLNFGPEVVAEQVRPGCVVARAAGDDDGSGGGEVATLVDWSDGAVDLTLAHGIEEPELDGWTFPRAKVKIPSYTVTLSSRASDALLVHGLVLGRLPVPDVVAAVVDDEILVDVTSNRGGAQVAVPLRKDGLRMEASK